MGSEIHVRLWFLLWPVWLTASAWLPVWIESIGVVEQIFLECTGEQIVDWLEEQVVQVGKVTPQECPSERILELIGEFLTPEHISVRKCEQIAGVPVPQVVEQLAAVSKILSQHRLLQRTVKQIVDLLAAPLLTSPELISKRTMRPLGHERGSCVVTEIVDVVRQERLSERIVEQIGVIFFPQTMEGIEELLSSSFLSGAHSQAHWGQSSEVPFSERIREQTSDVAGDERGL